MQDSDIFDSNEYETHLSISGSRLCFALARKCSLYQYEKRIGVNFSVHFDSFSISFKDDPNAICVEQDISGTDVGCDSVLLRADVLVYDFNNDVYEPFGSFDFAARDKEWVTNELMLKSAHIGDDSQVRIKFSFALIATSYEMGSRGLFSKKKAKMVETSLTDGKEYVLESILDGERKKYSSYENKKAFFSFK